MTDFTTTELHILENLFRRRYATLVMEGLEQSDYSSSVARLREGMEQRGDVISLDFKATLGTDACDLMLSLKDKPLIHVYNFDLFAEDMDPKDATMSMNALRSAYNQYQNTQLLIARPEANLDYNSRKGFTFHDNHPLGNWAEFARMEAEKLTTHMYPIKHRN